LIYSNSIATSVDNATTYDDFHASNLIDALTFLLLELRAPELVRQLMVALQGLLSGRSTVVRFKRVQLAVRMFKPSNGWIDAVELTRMKNRVTGYLTTMQDWIHEEGLQAIIDYQPGTKTTDSRIRTSLFRWSVEIAKAAEQRLHPDSGDHERRQVFIDEARRLVNKRLARAKKPTVSRLKREPSATARWKMAMTIAKGTFDENRAKLKFSPDEIITFLCNELRRNLELHHLENPWCEMQDGLDKTTQGTCSLENSRDDQIEGAQGGDCVTKNEPSDNLTPPCAPSLPDSIELSDRDGDHWRALNAAASVGGVPVAWLRKDGDIRHCIHEDVNSLTHFLSEFDSRVAASIDARESLIVRLSDGVFQRDDCDAIARHQLEPYAFMTVETSPGSYHCWFALAPGQSRVDFHKILNAAGIGGNSGGTNSGRWPGTLNGKPERNGWIVRLVSVAPGRLASLEQIRAAFSPMAGDAHRPKKQPVSSGIVRRRSDKVRFPDYTKCLRHKNGDRSEADGSFITIAADYHFTADEIFYELRRVSERFKALSEQAAWIDFQRVWSKFVRL